MLQIGNCYKDGVSVEKDENKVFLSYNKCAEMGNAAGINNLGHCYLNGIGSKRMKIKSFPIIKNQLNWVMLMEYIMR